MKITKLTKEQEAKIPYYRDKWLSIGKDCTPISFEQVKPIINNLYTEILGYEKPLIIIMPNPIWTWYATVMLYSILESGSQIRSQIDSQIYSQIDSQIGSQIYSQIHSQIGSQIGSQIRSQIDSQIDSQIYSQIDSQIYSQIRSQIRSQIGSFVWPYIDGNLWVNYFGYYEFFFNEVVKCETEKYKYFRDTSKLHLVYPLKNICILSQKPKYIEMKDDLLHCESGPSIEYEEDFKVWSLNGVQMPQWVIETKDTDLDPCDIRKLGNAQQRAEFIKKVGRERIAAKTIEKVLDEKTIHLNSPVQDNWPCHYRVLRLNYGNGVIRHALEMPNASLPEMWHIEYVPKEITTVEQAMNFRLKRKEEDIDDINGEDWYLHGDRVLVPQNAKKVKRWPKMIA